MLQVGNLGNRGGTGRPPSAIRALLRDSFANRIATIEDIADGKPIQRTEVALKDVLPHVMCGNCAASNLVPKHPDRAAFVVIEGLVSASALDRIKAIDLTAKYGLGTTSELTVDAVRGRLEETIRIIRDILPEKQANTVLDKLDPVWRG